QNLSDERAYAQMGLSQLRRNALSEAVASFENALEKNPYSADAWANLCLALGRSNQLLQAEEACVKALDLNPRSTAAWGNLGKVKALKGDLEGAVLIFEEALQRN